MSDIFEFYLSGNSDRILLTLSIFIIFIAIILITFYLLKLMKVDFSFGNFHWRNTGDGNSKKETKKEKEVKKDEEKVTENLLPVIDNLRLTDKELIDKILTEIKKNNVDTDENNLKKQQEISKEYWKAVKDNKNLTNELDRSKIKIKELTEINTKLRKKIEVLNDKLIEYNIQKEPTILKYQDLLPKLKMGYIKIMKNIVLMKRPSTIDDSKYEAFTKRCMDQIVYYLLSNIYNSSSLFSKLWTSYDSMRSDFVSVNYSSLKPAADKVFRHFKDNGNEVANDFKVAKTDLDKKIVAAGNIIAKQMHERIFNNKQFQKESMLNAIENSDSFMFMIWDSETFYKVVNRASLETVNLYEKTKQSGIDKNLIVSEQLFESMSLKYEEFLKTRILERFEKNKNKK